MDDSSFVDQYFGVLGSLESQIVAEYRENPELTDYEAGTALDALIKDYRGEGIGHVHKAPQNPNALKVYESVGAVCELFLGREKLADGDEKEVPALETLSVDEIIACLKRLRKSADYWTREAGRQGYLDYLKNFL